jgi:uncharacterized protein (TIGR02246 family)
MRYLRLVPALAFASVVAFACGGEPADETAEAPETATADAMPSDEEAIDALAEYWVTHYNMQHPDMVASVYTDSAWVMPADGGMFEGREAVAAWLAGSVEPAPTATVTPVETLLRGDVAVGLGTYTVSMTDDAGETMGFSGSYMNVYEKVDGEWKVEGMLTNYDAPPPAEWQWNAPYEGEAPPSNPAFPDLIDAYEAAFNAGDAAGIAALYVDDAKAAFSNGPIVEGPAAIQASMAERMTPGATIEIHEAGNADMGDGWRGGGGWYEIMGPDGAVVQTGYWMNVLRMQDDGTPKIAWTLTNARPAGM